MSGGASVLASYENCLAQSAREDARPTNGRDGYTTMRVLDSAGMRDRLASLDMLAITDPNLIVGGYALIGLVGYLFWRFIVWVRDSPTHPDPWDAETEQKLLDPETRETCPSCSTPQEPGAWFCEHCGRAVGPYNNLMPYVNVFSEGEVFRNGASGRFRNRPLILAGYIVVAISTYVVFAPVYLFFLLRKYQQQPVEVQESAKEPETH